MCLVPKKKNEKVQAYTADSEHWRPSSAIWEYACRRFDTSGRRWNCHVLCPKETHLERRNGETASWWNTDEIKVETSRKRNEDPGSSGRSCHDISEPQNNLVETYKKTLFGAWIHSSKSHKSTAFRLRFFFCPSPRLHRRHPPRCSRQSSSRTHSWLRSWKLLELLLVLPWWFLVPNGPNIPLELGLEVDLPLEKKSPG